MTDYEYIREKIPADELLCQLMEECGELSAAANHLRRARNGVNPTIIPFDQAEANFAEEVADVLTTLNAIGGYTSALQIDEDVIQAMRYKAERWKARLKANGALRTGATAQGASAGSAGLASGGCAPAGRACAEALRRDCYEAD